MSKRKSRVKDIAARNVLNSIGDFCLEIEVLLDNGTRAYESSPAGTTTGKYDAKLISSNEAIKLLPVLRNELIGLAAEDQLTIDNTINNCLGDENERIYGANLSTATSMAICKAAATSFGIQPYQHLANVFDTTPSIPQLIVNVLNGGAHAGNGLPITEFMLVTRGCTGIEALMGVTSIYHELRDILKTKYGLSSIHVGLEGGFAPAESDPQKAIEHLTLAIDKSCRQDLISIGLDVAAGNLFDPQRGEFKFGNEYLSTEDLVSYYIGLIKKNNKIIYLEDPLAEDQVQDWVRLCLRLPDKIIAGDDLIATSSKRLSHITALRAVNAVVLKINQCGTISALVECLRLARAASLVTIMSQRSRETDSDFLTHLSVGLGTDYLKAGACARERIIKYNSLLRIAENFQPEA
jgi:enolase